MKILQINKFHYIRGGSERYYFNLSKLLETRGHQVVHFSTQGAENVPSPFARFFAERIDIKRFNWRALTRLFHNREAVAKLEALLDQEKPEVAHLHNIDYHLTPALITALKRRGIPVVMTLHDYRLFCPNYKLYTGGRPCMRCRGGHYWQCLLHRCAHRSITKSLLAMLETYFNRRLTDPYGQVDRFLAPSRYLKDIAVSFGMPAEKLIVLHNFLDINELPSIAPAPDTPPYLLYYGRLSAEKGLDLLVRAFAAAADRVPFDLKIVGSGPELQALEIMVHDLKLHDRITFTGRKQERELWELVANAAAVAVPSRWPENWPYSVLEAQSYGKPVIAAAIGGLPEMVEDGVSGWLFPAGDRSVLSELIAALPYADRNRLGEAAKRSAARFDPDTHYRAIMEVYENVKQ